MKRIFSILSLAIVLSFSYLCGWSQVAKKPTIMVVPAADWCQRNGYVDALGNSDYKKALYDSDMLNAIAAMGDYMAAHDYPMVSLEQGLANAETEEVYNWLVRSNDGYGIIENDIDRVSLYGSSDIIMSLSLDRVKHGPDKWLEVRVTTVDAASGKILHGDGGQSSISAAPFGRLVMESVQNIMPVFLKRIDSHFLNMEKDGREGSVVFMIAEDCPLNMESTVSVDGQEGELAEYIEYWLDENCVRGDHSGTEKSPVRLKIRQMRIPRFGKAKFGNKVRALDANSFIRGMEKELASFGVSMSTVPVGIGKVLVTLGAAE